MGELISVEEPPGCIPPLPCALGWTEGILYPWGVWPQAADRWHSPMADAVEDGWLAAC